jgi:hypothetical protein
MSPLLTVNTVHGATGVPAGVYLIVEALILLIELDTLLCKQLHTAHPAQAKLCLNLELAQMQKLTLLPRHHLFKPDVQFLVSRALGL